MLANEGTRIGYLAALNHNTGHGALTIELSQVEASQYCKLGLQNAGDVVNRVMI